MKKIINFLNILLLLSISNVAFSQISGTVYRDFNSNGVKDNNTGYNEVGFQGITVMAYDATGAQLGSAAISDANGAYTITGVTGDARVEFTGLETGDYASFQGSGNQTSVQFVTAPATNVDFAVNYPLNYNSSLTPQLAVPCYFYSGAAANRWDGEASIIQFDYESDGTQTSTNLGGVPTGLATGKTVLATMAEVGSVNGIAISPETKDLFAGAFQKRHSDVGPEGNGAIYRIDAAGNVSTFINLDDFFGVDAAGPYSHGGVIDNEWVYDDYAFGAVGKVALGDIDIAEDLKSIFVVNLFDRKIYQIPTVASGATGNDFTTVDYASPADSRSADIKSFDILAGISAVQLGLCPATNIRPFGLAVKNGLVYVGLVNSAESDCNGNKGTEDDLQAYVYTLDPTTGNFSTNPVLQFDLNYEREYQSASGFHSADWRPWASQYGDMELQGTQNSPCQRFDYSQPLLSDIEFDVNGDMILGFMDILGHQNGVETGRVRDDDNTTTSETITIISATCSDPVELPNADTWRARTATAGDILRATYDFNSSSWSSETSVGGYLKTDEYYNKDRPAGTHEETAQGGLLLISGLGEVLSTSMNAGGNVESGGIAFFENADQGTYNDGIELFKEETGTLGSDYLGKASGLGDLQAFTDAAPIEIGNRVWFDTNEDGVQDPGEIALDGVEIELCAADGSTVLGTTTTANGGQWYFNDSNVNQNGATGLEPETAYVIKVTTALDNAALATYTAFTLMNSTSSNGEDILNDNNANASGIINYTTGITGANDHSLDIGVTQATCVVPDAGENVTICLPKTSIELIDAPSGNEWIAASGNPSAAVIDASTGAVTGMTATGVYTFTLQSTDDASCSDDITITVSAATPYILCNDGSTSVTATAEPGITDILWFNEAGTQVGTGTTLTIDSNLAGLEDGTEWFYYTGKDATDCDVELCCPVVIITEDCCPTPNCLDVTVIKK